MKTQMKREKIIKIRQSNCILSSLFPKIERHVAYSSPSHFAAWRQTPSICFLIFSCTQLSITAGKFHMFSHFPFSKHIKSFTKSRRPCVDLFLCRVNWRAMLMLPEHFSTCCASSAKLQYVFVSQLSITAGKFYMFSHFSLFKTHQELYQVTSTLCWFICVAR